MDSASITTQRTGSAPPPRRRAASMSSESSCALAKNERSVEPVDHQARHGRAVRHGVHAPEAVRSRHADEERAVGLGRPDRHEEQREHDSHQDPGDHPDGHDDGGGEKGETQLATVHPGKDAEGSGLEQPEGDDDDDPGQRGLRQRREQGREEQEGQDHEDENADVHRLRLGPDVGGREAPRLAAVDREPTRQRGPDVGGAEPQELLVAVDRVAAALAEHLAGHAAVRVDQQGDADGGAGERGEVGQPDGGEPHGGRPGWIDPTTATPFSARSAIALTAMAASTATR